MTVSLLLSLLLIESSWGGGQFEPIAPGFNGGQWYASETATVTYDTTMYYLYDDTYNNAEATTTNYGTGANFQTKQLIDTVSRVAFCWNDTIDDQTNVIDAELKLHCIYAITGSTDSTFVYGCDQDWVEAELTWLIYSTGNSWDSEGGDYSGKIAAFSPVVDTWATLDITSFVQGLDGSQDGIALISVITSTVTGLHAWASTDNADSTLWPRITIIKEQ